MQYQGKSTTGCDDQWEDYYEWTDPAQTESDDAVFPAITIMSVVGVVVFLAFVGAANLLLWALSMIGGA